MPYLTIFLFVFYSFFPIFSIEKQQPQGNTKEFHLKLGASEDSIAEFVIKLPNKFLISYDISARGIFGQEFIQIGEKFESWSEIITVQERIVYGADIKEFIETITASYLDNISKIECQPSIKNENNVPVAILMVDTPSLLVSLDSSNKLKQEKINGKNEIIGTKIVQGKFSLATVQYAIKYQINTTSTQEKEAIKEKVLSFLNSCHITQRSPSGSRTNKSQIEI